MRMLRREKGELWKKSLDGFSEIRKFGDEEGVRKRRGHLETKGEFGDIKTAVERGIKGDGQGS